MTGRNQSFWILFLYKKNRRIYPFDCGRGRKGEENGGGEGGGGGGEWRRGGGEEEEENIQYDVLCSLAGGHASCQSSRRVGFILSFSAAN